MDVKDIIKWLFQATGSKDKNETARVSFKTSMSFLCLSVFIVNLSVCCGHQTSNVDLQNSYEFFEGGILEDIVLSSRRDFVGDNIKDLGVESSHGNETKQDINKVDKSDGKLKDLKDLTEVLRILRNGAKYLDNWLKEYFGKESGRTFGRPIKKLQAMMIPLMFKLGVLSTIIILTFLLALKAVAIGKLLVVLKLASLLGNLFLLKSHGSGGQEEWTPGKQIHVHIHNTPSAPGHVYSHAPSASGLSGFSGYHEGWSRRDPYSQDVSYSVYNNGQQQNLGASIINTPYGRYVRTGSPTAPGFKR